MNSVLLIHTSILFTSVTLAIIFFMAWRTIEQKPYTLIWAITFLAIALQRVFNIVKEDIQPYTLYWMMVCGLSMLSVVLGAWGHFLRTKSGFATHYLFYSMALMLGATYYFTAINPHVGLRMSLYVFYNAALLLFVGVVILKYRPKPLAAEVGASVSYLILGVFQAASAVFALMQGQALDPIYREIYVFLNFVTLPAAFTAMGLFVVFILASDLSDKMKRLAMTDPLTDCLNRRGFYELAESNIRRMLDKSQHVCLIYFDIDKFKDINDQHGHAAGDAVLTQTVDQVKTHIKQGDLFGRIGGEEFVVLLGRIELAEARQVAERLRSLIAANPVIFSQQEIPVTASFGVVFIEDQTPCVEKAIDIADNALYRAKSEGRNQVVLA